MPTPEESGLLTFEIIAGPNAVIQPTRVPILFEYDGYESSISRTELHCVIDDPQLSLKVEDHEIQTVVLGGAQGPAGAPGRPGEVVVEVDTALVSPGRLVFSVGDNQVAHTDSRYLQTARIQGAFTGVNGRITAIGAAELLFASPSPDPVAGEPVLLAAANDEPSDGAAGKVTMTVPSSGFASLVGYVLDVPADFSSTRKAIVMVRPGLLVKRNP